MHGDHGVMMRDGGPCAGGHPAATEAVRIIARTGRLSDRDDRKTASYAASGLILVIRRYFHRLSVVVERDHDECGGGDLFQRLVA